MSNEQVYHLCRRRRRRDRLTRARSAFYPNGASMDANCRRNEIRDHGWILGNIAGAPVPCREDASRP